MILLERQLISSLQEENPSSLMGRCRRSIEPFLPSEAIQPVLTFVVETVSQSTPKDEGRSTFIQKVHRCVDKSLENKQPFLIKRE